MFDLDNKTFRIVLNEGPGAEVTGETTFHFRQQGAIVHADYWGGGVQFGKLLAVLEGQTLRQSYIQVNREGQFNAGHSQVQVELTEAGKIRLLDSWEWESQEGRGQAIIEEV